MVYRKQFVLYRVRLYYGTISFLATLFLIVLLNHSAKIYELKRSIKCEPRKNIVFLKTHKCASTAIQNILLRRAYNENLTVALPPFKNYFAYEKTFSRTEVLDPVKYNITYNIFAHHTRFNQPQIARIMPKDSVYVTILRNPVDVFESMFYYFDLDKVHYNMTLAHLLRYHPSPKDQIYYVRALFKKFGPNQNTFDLGLDDSLAWNIENVKEFIKFIDQQFDLVMISEKSQESLILLKHLLCWKTEDIMVFKLNARAEGYRHPITSEQRHALEKLNAADMMFYDYFSKKFDKLVKEFGEDRMKKEILELEAETDKWYNLCVGNYTSELELQEGWSKQAAYYVLKEGAPKECKKLLTPEYTFTEMIRERQSKYMPKNY